jgi:dihydropyrimidine dehydrogenase (NAD+) subunit PreA
MIACADTGYAAIRIEKNKAVVNPEKCDACGLCAVVCPEDAIRFIHRK